MKKIFILFMILLLSLNEITLAKNCNKENTSMKKITQTAGHNILGEFAPEFAHFNDDVLFGENWNNQDINLKTDRKSVV